MKYRKREIIAISMILVVIASSTLMELTIMPAAYAQSSLTPTSISSTAEFSTPGSGRDPWGTAFDSSGRVWVAMPGCDLAPGCPNSTPPGELGLFDPTTHSWITVVMLPSGFGQPIFVAVDHNNKVWFTMPVTNTLGMYDPASTAISQWSVPTASAGPWDLTIDSKGMIWFTEHYVSNIGFFNPGTQTFHEISTTTANSQPYGITVDASDNIWFTENPDTVAQIGEYSRQGVLEEFKIRNTPTGGSGLTPHMITVDPHGNIWWSEGWVSSIAMLDVSAAQPGTNNGVSEHAYIPCNGCDSHTSGISVDQQGLIWMDDSLLNIFGSFPVAGGSFSFYNTQGHPHDGLNVDAQNQIWFDEEFANKLAVAIQTPSATPTPGTPTPVVGSSIGQDSFQRANQALWGTASDGQAWSGDANNASVFSISGNTGLVSNTGNASYSAILGPVASDAEVYTTGSISVFSGSNFGAVLRWTDGNNWYKAYIDGTNLILQKKVNGNTSILQSVPFAATVGTTYTIHFRVVGSTLRANAWNSSGPEPTGWMITPNDSSLTTGHSGIRFLTQGGTATITSFQSNILTTSSPTPTPTTISTSTPTAGSTIGQDSFQRANQALWGTASDGQAWSGDANNASVFSISGNTGLVSNTGNASYSAVLGSTASNSEVYTTGSISSFNNSNFGAVLRWTDSNNWYKAYIDGTNLILQKKVNGVTAVVATVPFAATASTSYTLHFRAAGSTLTANVWTSSSSEPGAWMLTGNDSSLTSGHCGLRFLTQAGAATISAFQALSL